MNDVITTHSAVVVAHGRESTMEEVLAFRIWPGGFLSVAFRSCFGEIITRSEVNLRLKCGCSVGEHLRQRPESF